MSNLEPLPECVLKRATTKYIAREDRIRLTAENTSGQVVTLWFTQRLLNRVVPYLCEWLERRESHDLQDFAQQRAVAGLREQAPVRGPGDAEGALVRSLDIKTSKAGLMLAFQGQADSAAGLLQLSPRALRQWLSILHDQYVQAGWPVEVWPDWVAEARPSGKLDRTTVLH